MADAPKTEETAAEAAARATQEADDKAKAAAAGGAAEPDPYADIRGKALTPEQIDGLINKLQAANGEAAANRHKLKEIEAANETETQKKVREAKEAGAAETSEKLTRIIIKQAATSALKESGASQGYDSLIRLMDPEKLKVNEDGDVVGLDKEVTRIKTEFPALFVKGPEPVRRRTVAGTTLDAGAGKGGEAHKSSAQIHADRLLGRA